MCCLTRYEIIVGKLHINKKKKIYLTSKQEPQPLMYTYNRQVIKLTIINYLTYSPGLDLLD